MSSQLKIFFKLMKIKLMKTNEPNEVDGNDEANEN